MSLRSAIARVGGALALTIAACAPSDTTHGTGIRVSRLYYVLPAGTSPGAIYFVMTNATAAPDTLTAIESSAGAMVMIHSPMPAMEAITAIALAPGATERLAPGVRHAMVSAPFPTIKEGDSVRVTLTFARAGPLALRAAAITYADVDTATALRADDRE